ncbi:MAG: GyrI-like domain-containing protein [Chloroflexi bacterium]|nr:GyrI-like domain-containing protein [Chloroflexota bacterium]
MLEHVDFKRTLKDLYSATPKVKRIEAGRAAFLAVDGHGAPSGNLFMEAIQKVYSVAYTMKFMLKKAGVTDFVVAPLEALWYDDPKEVPDMSKWRWRVLVRIPSEVTSQHLEEAKKAVSARGGNPSAVEIVDWEEGTGLQMMHIGPYDQVGAAYVQLHAAAEQQRLRLGGPGHEIYLSDPRRVAPEKLKTIVRMPIVR